MNLNFSEFNFEVIDITAQGSAELSINKNGLSFSQRIADELGHPPYVRTMLDTEKKVFAIQACKQSDSNAVKFSKPKGEQKGVVTLYSTVIQRILRSIMSDTWDKSHRYKIPAKILIDSKAAIFQLDTAISCEFYTVRQAYIANEI